MLRPLYQEDENGCWIYQRGTCNGYGWYGRKYAHRFMYETHIGGLTRDTVLHHKCHNRMCVNPYHLVKTVAEEHQKHHQRELKRCANGHARTKNNLYITKTGKWQCRICKNERMKKYNARDNAGRYNKRLAIVDGVRADFGKMPVKAIAEKYGIGWRSVYRYAQSTPTKLGYF